MSKRNRGRNSLIPQAPAKAVPTGAFPNTLTPPSGTKIQQVSWQGPLPPPQVLAEYDNVAPGLSGRLVQLVEDQQKHRFGLENRHMDSTLLRQAQGQWIAAVIMLATIGGGILVVSTR